jgi:hypothetical protein
MSTTLLNKAIFNWTTKQQISNSEFCRRAGISKRQFYDVISCRRAASSDFFVRVQKIIGSDDYDWAAIIDDWIVCRITEMLSKET